MLFYPSFTITFSSQRGFDRSMSHRIWATFWQISLLSRKKIWFFKILHFMGILLRSLPPFVLMVLRATSWNSVQLLVCFCPPLCQRFWCQVFFHIYCSRYIAIYIYICRNMPTMTYKQWWYWSWSGHVCAVSVVCSFSFPIVEEEGLKATNGLTCWKEVTFSCKMCPREVQNLHLGSSERNAS